MGSKPWYATRESVKMTLDVADTARSNAQVDRAIDAASRAVEGFLHRVFYPEITTRFFDWPNGQHARSWRLWFGQHELISLTTLSSGGTTIPSTDYFLEPNQYGPPYDRIEVDLDSSSAFSTSGTHQRAITVTGLWGYTDDSTSAGTIAEALDASETGVDVDGAAAAALGVGSVLKVDSERMLVTERGTLDTTQNLGGSGLTSVNNNVTVAVTTGSAFTVGEVLLIDSEKMLITDIAGNNLTVIRAWDGSVLATHATSADIYAYRTLTVTRGALGTTAATHSSAAAITRWDPPAVLVDLVIAEAISTLMQARSGYARTYGSGESERELRSFGLQDVRQRARTELGRQVRIEAV